MLSDFFASTFAAAGKFSGLEQVKSKGPTALQHSRVPTDTVWFSVGLFKEAFISFMVM